MQSAQGVDASKQFLTEMIQEHQAAIVMASLSGQWSPVTAQLSSTTCSGDRLGRSYIEERGNPGRLAPALRPPGLRRGDPAARIQRVGPEGCQRFVVGEQP